ncbi:hypothetical protein ACIPYQ_34095 [Streptomyces sp. NPDC090045]|uniref:hypothetical protein n=1 Tax=Streptomyces sp. NPDC090045 TaxID=3365927 RepID=UPI003820A264
MVFAEGSLPVELSTHRVKRPTQDIDFGEGADRYEFFLIQQMAPFHSSGGCVPHAFLLNAHE